MTRDAYETAQEAATGIIDPLGMLETTKGDKLHKVSQTILNNADVCLRRAEYARHEEKFFSDQTICGTGYHAGLEVYYLNRLQNPDEVVPSPAIVEAAYDQAGLLIQAERDHAGPRMKWNLWSTVPEIVAGAQGMLHAYFSQGCYWPEDWKVIGVEQQLLMPAHVAGWHQRSTIDLVLRQRESGLLVLADHKSATKPWKRDKESYRKTNQPAMYVDGWERATGERPDAFVFDIMTLNGLFERRTAQVTNATIEGMIEKQRTILPLLEKANAGELELPGNTQSFLCSEKWCDFWDRCPFGAAFDVKQAA